jgi:hypothetical protein
MLDLYFFEAQLKAEREERDRMHRQRARWAEREPAAASRRGENCVRRGLARVLLALADQLHPSVASGGQHRPANSTLNGTT